MKYKVGSLFAGIGGVCLGFQFARTDRSCFQIAWANEIDKYACYTYRANFSHKLLEGDINKILHLDLNEKQSEIERYSELRSSILGDKIDVLAGGFPCQAFSIAGEMKGFDDERGNLFWSIIDLVKLLEEKFEKPRILFLENVKNLMSHDNGNTYRIIRSQIELLGYKVKEHVVNTMLYSDLPQNRERIYIVCFRESRDFHEFSLFDNLEKYSRDRSKDDLVKSINHIIDFEEEVDPRYYYTKEKFPHYFQPFPQDISTSGNSNKLRVNLDETINEKYQFYQLRRGQYVRKNMKNVCPSLTANMGMGGHNVPLIMTEHGIRKITPIEALKLQGFPVNNGFHIPKLENGRVLSDCHIFKQAGNSVSIPIITLIANEILRVLELAD